MKIYSPSSSHSVEPSTQTCQLCGHETLDKFVVTSGVTLWNCSMCGLFQNGALAPPEGYDGDYHDGYEKQHKRKLRTARIRLSRASRLLPSSNIRILDIGCSMGFTVEAAMERGWEGVGVDVSREAVEACCSRGLECYSVDGLALPFEEKSFDLVTSWHVIEHVSDVRKTLAEWQRVLKPGGILVMETPDASSPKVISRGKNYERFWAAEHTYTFSPATLSAFAQQAGFELLETQTRSHLSKLTPSMAGYAALYDLLNRMRRAAGLHKEFQIFLRRPEEPSALVVKKWMPAFEYRKAA